MQRSWSSKCSKVCLTKWSWGKKTFVRSFCRRYVRALMWCSDGAKVQELRQELTSRPVVCCVYALIRVNVLSTSVFYHVTSSCMETLLSPAVLEIMNVKSFWPSCVLWINAEYFLLIVNRLTTVSWTSGAQPSQMIWKDPSSAVGYLFLEAGRTKLSIHLNINMWSSLTAAMRLVLTYQSTTSPSGTLQHYHLIPAQSPLPPCSSDGHVWWIFFNWNLIHWGPRFSCWPTKTQPFWCYGSSWRSEK